MIVVMGESVPGQRVTEALGVVRGSTIRSKHIGKDIMAGLRSLVGGEVKEYTEMLVEARNESMNRMVAQGAGGRRCDQPSLHDLGSDVRRC